MKMKSALALVLLLWFAALHAQMLTYRVLTTTDTGILTCDLTLPQPNACVTSGHDLPIASKIYVWGLTCGVLGTGGPSAPSSGGVSGGNFNAFRLNASGVGETIIAIWAGQQWSVPNSPTPTPFVDMAMQDKSLERPISLDPPNGEKIAFNRPTTPAGTAVCWLRYTLTL